MEQSREALDTLQKKLQESEQGRSTAAEEWAAARTDLETKLVAAELDLKAAETASSSQAATQADLETQLDESRTALKTAVEANQSASSQSDTEKQVLCEEIEMLKQVVSESESKIDPGELDAIREEIRREASSQAEQIENELREKLALESLLSGSRFEKLR